MYANLSPQHGGGNGYEYNPDENLGQEVEHGNATRMGPWPRFEAWFYCFFFGGKSSMTTTTTITTPATTTATQTTIPMTKAATAQAMDSVAKGVMHASAAFFGPALLQLALHQVEMQQQQQQYEENDLCQQDSASCSQLLWGIWRPSSVLTTSSVIAVVLASIGIPFLGAYIDRQEYNYDEYPYESSNHESTTSGSSYINNTVGQKPHGRYSAGKWTAYLLVAIHFLQLLVHSSTWFFFWILHTLAEALNMIHQMYVHTFLRAVWQHGWFGAFRSSSTHGVVVVVLIAGVFIITITTGLYWPICKM